MADDLMELLASSDLSGAPDEIGELLDMELPVKTSIKKHEGYRQKSYLDSLGNPTVGWGHLLPKGTPKGISYPPKLLEEYLDADLAGATKDFYRLPISAEAKGQLSPDQRDVLIEMIFNMGLGKVKGFKKMLKAIEQGDTETAAQEMMKSKWAKQVGRRAKTLQRKFLGGKK